MAREGGDGGCSSAITVLLVDDHDLVRTGFRMILSVEDGIEVVAEAADGAAAVEAALRLHPAVILMDVQMPGLDGIEAARRIVATTACRVVILTTFEREDYLFSALEAGVSGFLLKSCGAATLVEGVRSVADGHALLAPQLTRRVIERFTAATRAATPDDPAFEVLTGREREVLILMADGLSNSEIAEQMFLGTATVKTHVSRILTKLDARDRVQAVVRAYRGGLVSPQGPA